MFYNLVIYVCKQNFLILLTVWFSNLTYSTLPINNFPIIFAFTVEIHKIPRQSCPYVW
jgi:hypothetical protein